MKLVAFLGGEKETLGQVSALVNRMDVEKVILIKNKNIENPFSNPKCVTVEIDSSQDLISFKQDIQNKLKAELSGEFEVALSIASGNGKEHMALISALLTLPVGIRLVAFTKTGIEFIS